MDFLHSKFFSPKNQKINQFSHAVRVCLRLCAHVRACMWVGELPILQFQRFFSEYVNLLFFDRV